MRECGLAIFVKTPGISPVKTRLARDIGSEAATDLYIKSVRAIEESALDASRSLPEIQPFWAVAEPQAMSAEIWGSLKKLPQGPGDLGARLAHVYSSLKQRFHSVILIGADSPQLTPSALVEVAKRLQSSTEPQTIVGPAADGGFYLFASNTVLEESFWTGVAYSTPSTLSELLARVPPESNLSRLPTLSDVDTARDLWSIRASLLDNAIVNSAQKILFDSIAEHLSLTNGIAFLCVANSARSQMAEGFARHWLPQNIPVASAGSCPSKLNPLAVQVMHEIGIDISSQWSKSTTALNLKQFDLVVTLCNEEICPLITAGPTVLHLPIPDPARPQKSGENDLELFRAVRDTLKAKLAETLAPFLLNIFSKSEKTE